MVLFAMYSLDNDIYINQVIGLEALPRRMIAVSPSHHTSKSTTANASVRAVHLLMSPVAQVATFSQWLFLPVAGVTSNVLLPLSAGPCTASH